MSRAWDAVVEVFAPKKAIANRMCREALAAGRFGYRAATRNRIQVTKTGIGGSGDQHAKAGDLWQLREYSRALDRDNVLASAMLDRAQEAVIGTGIDIQVLSGSKRWDAEVERLWHAWWDTDADVRGLHVGWQIEHLAFRSMKVDGDILFILTDTGQIQPIEADRIVTPYEQNNKPDVVNGVKVNAYGRPIGFWVAPVAQSTMTGTLPEASMTFVNAEDAVFLANMNRFSLTRGIPVFATNMQLFDDIDAFIETCVLHAKIATSHVMFIERQNGPADIDSVETVEDSNDYDRQEQVVSPGMILYGKPGEQAKMVGTTQSMVQFGPFVQQLLRFTGLNFGMPLEMLSLDFSQTTYSSARAALLIAHKSFMAQHKMMTKRFLEPILRWKVKEWVRAGVIRERPFRVSATPPRFPSVDVLKEANGEVAKVQHGFVTNRDVCAGFGLDWEEVLRQRAEEIKQAMVLASQLNEEDGQKVDWRDLLGDAKNFDQGVYSDPSENSEVRDMPAVGNGGE
jgi:lambda family phage portal protein